MMSIGFILFTLLFNFFVSYDIFGSIDAGDGLVIEGDTTDEYNVFQQITGFSQGFEYIWLLVTTLAGIGAITLAIFIHSPVPIGAWLFSEIFLTSYSKTASLLYLNNYLPESFIVIITVGVLFLWVAALISMFTG